MRSRIMFSILFVSLFIFSCEKEVNDSPFTIHIKSQIDIEELKTVTLRNKLNTLIFDVPQGSDLDLSFLKDVESVYSLVIRGNAVNLHQLESLSHIENFKIENSFGTTKSYKFYGIKPSNLCFMLPVAKTEPLRIVIQEDRDRYYGNKIVEECI